MSPATPATAPTEQSRTTSESTDQPLVTIVILTWENYEETADCLDSLRSLTYDNYRVLVVDNGSEDGSIERLQSEYDWCEFVVNDENIGFARGNNVGIAHALDTGTDYVLLLNDDTVVTEDFLDPLVDTMDRYDRVAAVGGVNLLPDSGDVHNAGYVFHPWLAAKGELHREPVTDEPYPVDFVQSCLVLLNPEFLEDVGLLNERYFLGMEDVDLAWKARAKGWKVLVNPASRIYHRVGETATSSPFSVYHKVRNKLQFARENLSLPRRLPLYLSLVAYHLYLFARWTATGQSQSVRAALVGAADHLRDAPFRDYDELSG
ncbi:glycosyltransferase family 2 protein [Haloarcula onubensis]|uniref:Glycosyltransferase family 2 protein n=1 Tax=Haloarcula onubensis TaxID=2950539 RepID=A0ABU2FV66_9EURY|nr:glycosyltransferase family 2 protein [Halomicroarcula sp. S3CR25-11]MDS0284663.1 glycosyltransferase family 2 protein [Halomicroarcula sp. S3CR25-11]